MFFFCLFVFDVQVPHLIHEMIKYIERKEALMSIDNPKTLNHQQNIVVLKNFAYYKIFPKILFLSSQLVTKSLNKYSCFFPGQS